MSERLLIGTSGWHYAHWRGNFYPADLPEREFLAYYAERFGSVEINNSFYQQPAKASLVAWRNAVPKDFVFAYKANRYLTHFKKLKEPQLPLRNLYRHTEVLGDKLGPILFQLPPRWRCNLERLEAFLAQLSADHRHVFEFRDPSWHHEDVYEALRERNVAFCIYDLAGQRSPVEVTADFSYLRLHGPGAAYQGSYSSGALGGWLRTLSSWTRQGDAYCYFDNDEAGYAAENAARLAAMWPAQLH